MRKLLVCTILLLVVCGCTIVKSHESAVYPKVDTIDTGKEELSAIDKMIQDHKCEFSFEELYGTDKFLVGTMVSEERITSDYDSDLFYMDTLYTLEGENGEKIQAVVPFTAIKSVNSGTLNGYAPYIGCTLKIYYVGDYEENDVYSAKVNGFAYDVNEESYVLSEKHSKKYLDTYNNMETHEICCPEKAMLYVIKELGLANMEKGIFDTGGIYYYNGSDFIASISTHIKDEEIVFEIVYYKDGSMVDYYVNASSGEIDPSVWYRE